MIIETQTNALVAWYVFAYNKNNFTHIFFT